MVAALFTRGRSRQYQAAIVAHRHVDKLAENAAKDCSSKRRCQKTRRSLADKSRRSSLAPQPRQVSGLFIAEERGSHALKGVPEPVTLFRLVRARGGGRRSGIGQRVSVISASHIMIRD